LENVKYKDGKFYLLREKLKRGKYLDFVLLFYFESCKVCGEPFLFSNKDGTSCSRSCSNSGKNNPMYGKRAKIHGMLGKHQTEEAKRKSRESHLGDKNCWFGKKFTEEHKQKLGEAKKGINNPKYEGGYFSNNIPRYDLYVDRLEPIEKCRRNKEDPNILEVKCTYCGKWFIPTMRQTRNRIEGIDHNDTHRFYDSNFCKKECPIFGKHKHYKGQEGYSSREVQPELRQMRFAIDDYTCQKCEQHGGSLHCHHYEGIEQNPIESADLDMCITLCKKCHKFVHTLPGCNYYDLRKCI
jgi:hypothetical protein